MRRTATILAGRYELGPVLGRGGMADVHEGRDLLLGRRVAIKLLASPLARDPGFVERFRREARAVARLSHPGVVAVFDFGSDGDRHFLVTELVDGRTLADVLAAEGPLAAERAVDVARQVAEALGAAHAAGIVHRDVKPGNVMLSSTGAVKVLDFGIARAADASALTHSGWVMGSSPYLAPEQARGSEADPRTDLYALGCVLYEMLTGRPPFRGDAPLATLYQHVHETPTPPSRLAPVDAGLEAVVLRCLEKEPARRFGSAPELARALVEPTTRPMPVVGDDATTPLPVVGDEPTAPVPVARVEPTAPIARAKAGDRPAHRGRPRKPPRAVAVAVLIGLGALTVAATALLDAEPRRRAQQRAVGSPSPAATTAASPTISAETTEAASGVEGAFAALVASIEDAFAAGGIGDDHDADKLLDLAGKIEERYREDELEDVGREAAKLAEELDKLVEGGRVSDEAAGSIFTALQGLVSEIGAEVPSEGDEDDDGGDDD